MEEKLPCCGAAAKNPREANHNSLLKLSCVFRAFGWVAVIYTLVTIAFNWTLFLKSAGAQPAEMKTMFLASSLMQLVGGAAAFSIALFASCLAKLFVAADKSLAAIEEAAKKPQ